MKFVDLLNIGLIFVKSGSFILKLRPIAENCHEEGWVGGEKEIFISEGQYLDDERIIKDYGMILVSLQCSSGTGKLLNLNAEYY